MTLIYKLGLDNLKIPTMR